MVHTTGGPCCVTGAWRRRAARAPQEGLKAEPPPLTEAESGLRNEKIAIDDFQEKVANASRKVGRATCGLQQRCPVYPYVDQ